MTINTRSVFEKDGKLYPQVFQMTLCMNYEKYGKRDVSEGIDTNKTRVSKECMLCHIGT